jgi:hypothetical protein
VALLLRKAAGLGQGGGVNGLRVIACGQTAVARRDGLRDGGLQTGHQRKEQRKRRTEQRKLTDGLYHAQGVMVSGVRGATTLFASKAQGKAPQDETRNP